jgi:predicted extracellular nuclease
MKQWFTLLASLLLFFPIASIYSQPACNGRLLFTEFAPNPPGEDVAAEWIEIANVGTAVQPLGDIKLGDAASSGSREGMARFPADALLESGAVIVVAQTAVGYRALFGQNPTYELTDSDPTVPDMRRYLLYASGDIALNNGGDDVRLLDAADQPLDAVSYGDSFAAFVPSIPAPFSGQSAARMPADCDTDSAADWQILDSPTPDQLSFEGECRAPVEPAVEALPPIGVIQGAGDVSPYVNEIVSLRGVVTGSYADQNSGGITFYTLFVQDPPGAEDGDPATSDGVAIFLGRERPLAQIGDLVRVTGQVVEFFDFTEITDDGLEIVVEASNQPLPDPIPIQPPADLAAQAAYFEPLEAMRVALDGQAQVVGATFRTCAMAVVHSSVTGLPIVRQSASDAVGQIVPILHTNDVDCTGFPNAKTGDRIAGLVGPLIYHFDQYKLVQQEPDALTVTAVATPTLPTPPTLAPGQFAITTFNLENDFDDIDDTGTTAEPKFTPDEMAVKQEKLAAQLSQVLGCPALVGIQEVENDTRLYQLALTAAEACGFTYAVTHRESADVRGIDVALLSDPRRVVVQDAALQQACTPLNTGIEDETAVCEAGEWPLFSRPPLRVALTVDGLPLTVYVNHFKSKRGGEAETVAQRRAQAAYLRALVEAQIAQNPQTAVVVLGDFNDYELSEPMLTLTEGGTLTNVLGQLPLNERYSFVFSGAGQLLDGILLSPALMPLVDGVQMQHVNADYPSSLGDDLSPAGLLYRATDHDLPLLVLNPLPASAPPVAPLTVAPLTVAPLTVAPPTVAPAAMATAVTDEPTAVAPVIWVLGGVALLGVVFGTAVWFRRRST